MLVHNVGVANAENSHTRTNPSTGGKSAPDATICSNPLLRWIADSWRVEGDMGSDHLPISFALPCRAQKKKRGRGKCSFKKARWSDFKKDLESVHLASPPPEDARPGVLYAWIRDTILASAKKNIPFGARRGPNKPFWNDACEAARLDCNRARKHAERTKSGPAINGYNRARRKATHTIAEEQVRNLDEAVGKLDTDSNLFKFIKDLNGEGPTPLNPVAFARTPTAETRCD